MTVVSFKAARDRTSKRTSPAFEDASIPTPVPRASPEFFAGATIAVDEAGTYHCSDDGPVTAGLFERDRVDAAIRPRGAVRGKIEDLVRAAWIGERPSSVLCHEDGSTYLANAGVVPLCGREMVCFEIRPLSPPTWSNRDLANLFGLTEREAQVTQCLMHGDPVPSIAARLNVKATTVRQYLKLIYSKTSTTSQVQLVAMLTGGLRRPPSNPNGDVQHLRSPS